MGTTYKFISKVEVGSGGQSTIVFSSIPQTYTHLAVLLSARTNRSDSFNDYIKLLPNGSSSNWIARFIQGTGTTTASYTQSIAANIVGEVLGNTGTANIFGNTEIIIADYASTTQNKKVHSENIVDQSGVGIISILAGEWQSASAVTSLTISPGVGSSFLQYTNAYLYGILKA